MWHTLMVPIHTSKVRMSFVGRHAQGLAGRERLSDEMLMLRMLLQLDRGIEARPMHNNNVAMELSLLLQLGRDIEARPINNNNVAMELSLLLRCYSDRLWAQRISSMWTSTLSACNYRLSRIRVHMHVGLWHMHGLHGCMEQ
jgi:hypothetical protein